MIFEPTPFAEAWIITMEPHEDERGSFARTFCSRELEARGIQMEIRQANTAYSRHAGTIRGLHYQTGPAAEAKLIRCIKGSLCDVLVDMRPESPTYLKHMGIELSAENNRMMYVPRHFAHGYLTLEPDTEACYFSDNYYTPDREVGVRYNDPTLAIPWPIEAVHVSEKDQSWPLVERKTT